MFKSLIFIMLLTPFLGFATTKDEDINALTNKMFEEQFEIMSKGMTPEMKLKLKKTLDESRRSLEDFNNLSPEQKKAMEEKNNQKLKSVDLQNKAKASYEAMSDDEKEMIKIMIENTKSHMKAIQDPKSAEHKALIANKFENKEYTPEEIIKSKSSTAYELSRAANTLEESKVKIRDSEQLLALIIKHPNSDGDTYRSVAKTLAKAKPSYQSEDSLLKAILYNKKLNKKELNDIVGSYLSFKDLSIISAENLKNILGTAVIEGDALVKTAWAIGKSKSPLVEKDLLWIQIINSPNASIYTLSAISGALRENMSFVGVEKVYSKLLNSPLLNVETYSDGFTKQVKDKILSGKMELNSIKIQNDPLYILAEKTRESDVLIVDADKIINSELDNSTISDERLGVICSILKYSKVPLVETEMILKKVINSPNAGSEAFSGAAYYISNAKVEIVEVESILNKIINSPKSDDRALAATVFAMNGSFRKIEDKSKMAMLIYNKKNAGAKTNVAILKYLTWTVEPLPNSNKLILDILNSPKQNEETYPAAVELLRKSRLPIENSNIIFKKLLSESSLDKKKVKSLAEVLKYIRYPVIGIDKLIYQMANMPVADDEVLIILKAAVENKYSEVKDPVSVQNHLNKIIK